MLLGGPDKQATDAVRTALSSLVFRFPLAGFSLLGQAIHIVERDIPDAPCATDGRKIYYSPGLFMEFDEHDRVFLLLHEWLHVFGNHHARGAGRSAGIWNDAIDRKVNREASTCLKAGCPNWLIQPEDWDENLTAEQVYDLLASRDRPVVGKPCLLLEPEGTTGPDEQQFLTQFSQELAQAVHLVEQMRRTVPEVLRNRLGQILRGRIPWDRLLRADSVALMGNEYVSWSPPNRKYYPLLLPKLKARSVKKLVIGMDVSASMPDWLVDRFISNITPAAQRAQEIVVVVFDEILRDRFTTRNPRMILDRVKFESGAHSYTDARPVFEVAEEVRATETIVLTDGWVELPKTPVPNTLWCIPEGGHPLPWARKNYVMEVAW